MEKTIARREFLQTVAGGALAGAGLGAGLSTGAPLAHAASADLNADSKKMPRLLAGCCAYSYREQLSSGQMTYEDFILKAVELGLDAVDMTVYYFKSTDPGYLDSLRHLAYKNAVAFSGAACNATMVKADAAKRAEVLGQIRKWVDVTDRLGASHLRIFAGDLPPGVTLQQATDWTVETMKAACDYSAEKGIMLGIEDHGNVASSADVCLEIMQRVNSPYAGINLDITHFIPTPAQDAYAQIAACIPYATVSHIRDHWDDGKPLDMDRVWKLYAEAGHKGYMSVEYSPEEAGEPATTGAPKLIAKTRELCRKYSSV
ncbi:MAG: sugar phosphate isomerase/epimerase family protein [Terracidiphilus sp.]|jgi:sugar phosphate isomerase/epimerase